MGGSRIFNYTSRDKVSPLQEKLLDVLESKVTVDSDIAEKREVKEASDAESLDIVGEFTSGHNVANGYIDTSRFELKTLIDHDLYNPNVPPESGGGETPPPTPVADTVEGKYIVGVWYDTSDRSFYALTAEYGLGHSTNDGQNYVFKSYNSGLATIKCNRLVKVAGHNMMLVATSNGLAISLNGGVSFFMKTKLDGLPSNKCNDIVVLPLDELGNLAIYVATDSGIAVSTDMGASFLSIDYSGLLKDKVIKSIAYRAPFLYIGTSGYYIYKKNLSKPNEPYEVVNHEDGISNQYINRIVVTPDDRIIVATDNGLCISNIHDIDRFSALKTLNGLPSNVCYDVLYRSGKLYIATNTGISKISNYAVVIKNMSVKDGLSHYVCHSLTDNDDGTIAVAHPNGISHHVKVDFLDNEEVNDVLFKDVAVDESGQIYQTSTVGLIIKNSSGEVLSTKTVDDGLGSNVCRSVAYDSVLHILYVATDGGLSMSVDYGATFTNNPDILPNDITLGT